MKLTDQQRAELKALATKAKEGGYIPLYRLYEIAAESGALLADLEEAGASINQGRQLLREEMQRSSGHGEQILKLEAELAAVRKQLEQNELEADLYRYLVSINSAAWESDLIDEYNAALSAKEKSND